MRTCKTCGEEKPLDEYWLKDKKTDRRDGTCKPCRYQKNLDNRSKNREAVRKQGREWHAKNADKVAQRRRERKSEMTADELELARTRQREAEIRYNKRREREWKESGKLLPKCACGCGDRVKLGRHGQPNTYIFGHQVDTVELTETHLPRVPVEEFRANVRKICGHFGWSIRECAEAARCSYRHLEHIMYSNTKGRERGLNAEWVTNFYRRCFGQSAPPSASQLRKARDAGRYDMAVDYSFAKFYD